MMHFLSRKKDKPRRTIRSALVTGATGMIGATLVRTLLRENVRVYAVIRPDSKKRGNLPEGAAGLTVIERDIAKTGTLELPEKIDALFHFAWEGTYGDARNDAALQERNAEHAMEAVRLAKRLGAKVFVGAGSQAEYGRTEERLTPETPCRPENEYGKAKLKTCLSGNALAEETGIDFVWTRILSVYGPFDNDFTLISSAIRSLSETGRFAATKGEQVWNYLYSEDAAEWFYRLAKYGKSGSVYVLAGPEEKTLREFLTELALEVSPEAKIGFGEIPYRPGQVMKLTADTSKTVEDTKYAPKTAFPEGIAKTIEWMRKTENKAGL